MKASHSIALLATVALLSECGQSVVGNAVPQGATAMAKAHRASGSSGVGQARTRLTSIVRWIECCS